MRSTGTRQVILGILQWGPRSGYEIKQLVDRSTRFFWAASYGQIYPELQRLERDGLIEGEADVESARRRRPWRLTDAGRAALIEWLVADDEPLLEMRDEGMLRFFFAQALPRAEAQALAARLRRRHERLAERLEQVREDVYGAGRGEPGFPRESLEQGIAMQHSTAAWYADAERRLGAGEFGAGGGRRPPAT